SYTLTAVATDNKGAVTTSAAVSISVTTASTLPNTLTFTPSADNATNVSYYVVNMIPAGSTNIVASSNIGMPAIVNNTMTVNIGALVQSLTPGTYDSTVTAVGPGGSTSSVPSNTFTR